MLKDTMKMPTFFGITTHWVTHGCCLETFYMFAYCGLVGNSHLAAKTYFVCSPSNVNQEAVQDPRASLFERKHRLDFMRLHR